MHTTGGCGAGVKLCPVCRVAMDIACPITCLIAKQINEAVVPPAACRGYNSSSHSGCYWTGRPGAEMELHEMGCAHATHDRFSELAQRQLDMEQQLQYQTEVIDELTAKVCPRGSGLFWRELVPHPYLCVRAFCCCRMAAIVMISLARSLSWTALIGDRRLRMKLYKESGVGGNAPGSTLAAGQRAAAWHACIAHYQQTPIAGAEIHVRRPSPPPMCGGLDLALLASAAFPRAACPCSGGWLFTTSQLAHPSWRYRTCSGKECSDLCVDDPMPNAYHVAYHVAGTMLRG